MAAPLAAASQPEFTLGISPLVFGSFFLAPKWLQPLVVYAAILVVVLRLKAFAYLLWPLSLKVPIGTLIFA